MQIIPKKIIIKGNTTQIIAIIGGVATLLTALGAFLGPGIIEKLFPSPSFPTAVAGGVESLYELESGTLTGNGSSSPNGEIKSYKWVMILGRNVTLDSKLPHAAYFTAPEVESDSKLVFQLIVTDVKGLNSSPSSHTVIVKNRNKPPIINVSQELEVNEGSFGKIDATSSRDPDSRQPLTYLWKIHNGSSLVSLIGEDTPSPKVISQSVNSDNKVIIILTISDKDGAKANEFITLKIRNIEPLVSSSLETNDGPIYRSVTLPNYHMASNILVQSIQNSNDSIDNTTGNGQIDKFGIQQIYPSRQDGQEWYMNMDDPANDINTGLRGGSMSRNSDGSWKIRTEGSEFKGDVHYNIYTSDFAGNKDTSSFEKTGHSEFAKRGFMFKKTDWKDVEITGYMKMNDVIGENESFASYARGAVHSDDLECIGTAYRNHLFYNGDVQFQKEQWHPFVLSTGRNNIGSVIGEWIGFKNIIYNIVQDGRPVVKLEMWIDISKQGTSWLKINEYVDEGSWGADGTKCGGEPDQIISWGGPIVRFGWDRIRDIDVKNLSIREIQSPAT